MHSYDYLQQMDFEQFYGYLNYERKYTQKYLLRYEKLKKICNKNLKELDKKLRTDLHNLDYLEKRQQKFKNKLKEYKSSIKEAKKVLKDLDHEEWMYAQ